MELFLKKHKLTLDYCNYKGVWYIVSGEHLESDLYFRGWDELMIFAKSLGYKKIKRRTK